jgi:hypothetical protein
MTVSLMETGCLKVMKMQMRLPNLRHLKKESSIRTMKEKVMSSGLKMSS